MIFGWDRLSEGFYLLQWDICKFKDPSCEKDLYFSSAT